MMKKFSTFFVFILATCFLLPPFVNAQSQQLGNQEILDYIFNMYGDLLQDHGEMVDSARDIINSPEDDYLRSLLNQIDGAGQAVQDAQSSGIAIAINPSYPEPYQEITASLSGYGVTVNEALVTWFVDGQLVRSGTGITSISTTLGAAGEPKVISASVEPTNMAAFTRSTIITPGTIDLLWEAVDSHTHPFYRGKALPSYDSVVKITAITNVFDATGTEVPSNNLVYNWSLNGRVRDLSRYSGYSSNTAYAFASFLNKGHIVSTEISNNTRGIDARKSTLFVLQDPEIVFYKKEPLGGINYEVALNTSTSVSPDGNMRIIASPYYFDMRNGFSDLNLSWKINNSSLQNIEKMAQGEIPLATQDRGVSRLNLEISTSKTLQKSDSELRITVE